jgi:hypothetical protein
MWASRALKRPTAGDVLRGMRRLAPSAMTIPAIVLSSSEDKKLQGDQSHE